MSLPLEWMVLFLDEDNIKLRSKIAQSPTLKIELKEILDEIRSNLTSRQFQIFIYTIEGYSSKEIADKLFLSARTVDSHIKEILTKLKVEKRSQLSGIFFDGLKNKINSDSIFDL